MKSILNFFFLVIICISCNRSPIKYGKDYIVFEPEITKSDLDLWVQRKPGDLSYYKGDGIEAIHKNYLEFTGNDMNFGEPTSPLIYNFKAPKTGDFRIVMRMYQPLKKGEKEDKRNDIYIKLAGDFTSACKFSTETLKSYHKFFGRGVRKWGSMYDMEGHINGKKVLAPVVYSLKKGEEYTFTMAGRAQGCSIDYILLFDKKLELIANTEDLAITTSEIYRPSF